MKSAAVRAGCTALLASVASAIHVAREEVKVVVVGAGVSGLSAARTIVDHWPAAAGPVSVTVLEAGNRIGGRTFTDRSVRGWGHIEGAEVDVGASWIHQSCPEHPITRIKEALGLAGAETEDSLDQVHHCTGGQTEGCPELEESRFEDYEKMKEAANRYGEEADHDLALWEAMEKQDSGVTPNDPVMQYHVTNALEFNVGASPKTMSAKYYNNDEQFSGTETLLPGGYSQVPQAIQSGSITLSAPCKENEAPTVTKVADGHEAALHVELSHAVTSLHANGGRISVGLEDGSSVEADHVVLTVPLGVLKAKAIEFDPPLPQPTEQAIERLGFGNVLKIGVLFDKAFWPSDKHYFGLVHGEPNLEKAEKFSYFLNAAGVAKKPVLMTFAFGSSATEVEGWTDDKVKEGILANLKGLFGEEEVASAKIVGMWRSKWGTDPHFGGAYAYAAVGSEPKDWEALTEAAMHDKLHFAGEHTSMTYRGTVHGALLSGQRAACEILQAAGHAVHT